MAIVTPADVAPFLAICARWDVLATVIGEVTGSGRLEMSWHGEQVVDIPPGSAADDGPVYDRPVRRPASQDALTADDPGAAAAASIGGCAARRAADRGRPAGRGRQDLGHRAVRPLRPRRHRARHAARRRAAADRRVDRPRRRAGDRRERPVLPARSLRRDAARALRGAPERGGHRRQAAGGDQLPQLRLARGSRRDVAVRRGRARAGRRLPDTGHAGHRRERELLQPDRRRADPADAGRRGARRARGCPPPGPVRVSPAGASVVLLGATRAEFGGSLWAWVSAPAPRRPAAGGGLRRRARTRRGAGHGGQPRAAGVGVTTCPTAGWRSALAESCLAGGTGVQRDAARLTRSSRCSANPRRGRLWRSGRARRRNSRLLCASAGVPAFVIGTTGGDALQVTGLFEIPLDRAGRGALRAAAGPVRLTPARVG